MCWHKIFMTRCVVSDTFPVVFGLYPLQTTKIHNQDRLLLTKSLTARFTQSSQPNLWLCTGDLTGVNISPYFLDAPKNF